MANIDRLGSEECGKAIGAATTRLREINGRLQEIRRPKARRPAPAGAAAGGGGMVVEDDPLVGAGPEYRRIALEGTPAEMVDLEREREELEAERHQLALRREAMKNRQKRARAEEREAAAPGRLEELKAELPDRLERAETAIAEARAALSDLSAWLRDVESERKIVGDEEPYLEPTELRRLGVVLRHRVLEHTTWQVSGLGSVAREEPALFGSPAELAKAERLLGDPNADGLLDRLRRKLFGRDYQPHRDQLDQDVRRVRRALLASGELDRIDEAGTIATSKRRSRQIA